ncbi:autophagy-related protein 18h-like isoform X2 [Impatiens glandulifera]|uniref:autophagy-related protein 18h-like isoform X2 n=1 Tax=Impatiens glandulifera TaxID=253017 RepID=UPI001FB0CE65|nr:autophagy-related protein 18h-like isoform X2 [Impatiens glandulifera]
MKRSQDSTIGKNVVGNGFIPNSLRFISSCVKTVSSNVRSAGASVAGSISGDSDDRRKDQVLWASFDKLELGSSCFKHVLLLGYSNGFQVLDVEDASTVTELVSRRDGPVTFLQMQPIPAESDCNDGFRASHPILLVVASDETRISGSVPSRRDDITRNSSPDSQSGNFINSPSTVQFYSLKSHTYVHVLRFRSTVFLVRCSPRIVAISLSSQIYCFDALTLENKFSVLTYPVPQIGVGPIAVNVGYGPMAVGPRWLAYASNNPLSSNTGRLSPQSLTPPGVSPSTSPGSGSLMARYAMESSKQLAAGLINLGDMSYKTFTKYYHEHFPDGSSSPIRSNSGRIVGRISTQSTEMDNAGVVVVKDIVSRAVVCQFRAHTSPLSALCFDPSGTLLVTASVHGNNINIFRIMPSPNSSVNHGNEWSSSHVHLYKLHRGMTSAVIQDICFSHYSQWITVVSSKGTCHVFVLSPFGGETGLQLKNSLLDGPDLIPIQSQPWWFSASSLMLNQHRSPPSLINLSVVSRIRVGNSGWLNTVSSAASSATGKVFPTTSIVSAIFHNSVQDDLSALEHLLVYTPSGNLVQYDLLPSVGGGEQSEAAAPRTVTGSSMQMQDEELRVKSEPVQWWDVCRREDWPERGEQIYGIHRVSEENGDKFVKDGSELEEGDIKEKELTKSHEHSHWYLSNAEVQIRSGKLPVWQKPKIYFFRMNPILGSPDHQTEDSTQGEMEIEKIHVNEVQIKRKDLLPVFDRYHSIQSDMRDYVGERYSSPLNSHGVFDGEKPSSPSYSYRSASSRIPAEIRASESMDLSESPSIAYMVNNSMDEVKNVKGIESPLTEKIGENISREVESSSSVVTSESSNNSSNRSDSSLNIIDVGPVDEDMNEPIDFGHYFDEGYCRASIRDESSAPAQATITSTTNFDGSNSPCLKENLEEDGESDDMLGGVFAFYEEG